MKKIFALLLASVMAVSAVMFTSCGETEPNADDTPGTETEVSEESAESTDATTVAVKIVNAIDGETVILDALVEYEAEMTVLDATLTACAINDIEYSINEETSALESLTGLADFLYSDEATENNQWIYTLNGDDVYSADNYNYDPSTNPVAAGDAIVWTYNVAVAE